MGSTDWLPWDDSYKCGYSRNPPGDAPDYLSNQLRNQGLPGMAGERGSSGDGVLLFMVRPKDNERKAYLLELSQQEQQSLLNLRVRGSEEKL